MGPVHVGAREGIDGAVSLTLSTVECGGDTPWDTTSEMVADTWDEFDEAYGSHAAWESDLATVETLIREF